MSYKIGDIRNGSKVLPKEERKTILLLSDDMRLHSGVATMSKEFVIGTLHRYNWVQLGAAIENPDMGKILDISDEMVKELGIPDASLRIVPHNGYGNPQVLRQLLGMFSPDAIMHFTDPRYWEWLYGMEREVRQQCPIMFYAIWDNLPDPKYNRNYYESCDHVACISRQTYGIVKRLMSLEERSSWETFEDWQTSYVPHGINPDVFKPVDKVSSDVRNSITDGKDYDFIVFWNNRNIKRKQPGDVIEAYKRFCDGLLPSENEKCLLVMHTSPRDKNGTDLYAVKDAICPDYDIKFSTNKYSQEQLNEVYNLVDVTINLAGNEGFGLTTAESIMAGTPVILTVTGGLQDQCGFKTHFESDEFTAEDYVEIGSLHDKDLFDRDEHELIHGDWVFPIWPATRSLIGTIKTPYIYDDKVDVKEAAKSIMDAYNKRNELPELGKKGREWMIHEGGLSASNMSEKMAEAIDMTLENWEPKEKYKLHKVK